MEYITENKGSNSTVHHQPSMMASAEAEIAKRCMAVLMDSLRRREQAVTQHSFLEDQLVGTVQRLKDAHQSQQATFQYIHGLRCLVIWELQLLYRILANRNFSRAHRNALRARYFSEPHRRYMFPIQLRTQMWEEYHSFVVDGIDPEDHFTQDEDDYLVQEEAERNGQGMVFPEKLHCFVAWDVLKRED